ncbi:MAG TPA: F0F1 ATP synthase subunit A [Sphingobacteriaceae bacterium]|nr:F0F1 ATP synthase subunit A [Sphingobacteriaceae bacterium]
MQIKQILNFKKNTLTLFYVVFLGLSSFSAFAQNTGHTQLAEGSEHHEEAFNPAEAIIEHISDSHGWHLWGHTTLHLPVILYTNKGMETFSSSQFGHGEKAYSGKYYTYKLEKNKVKIIDGSGQIDEAATKKLFDISITKNVASLWLSILIILLVFFTVAASYRKRVGKAPKGLQSFIEPLVVFIRDEIAKPNIGYKYERFMPLLLTFFFFILVNNLMGLVPFFPGGANVTGNIAVTFVLAGITMLVTNFSANKYYWKHIFLPSTPKWLYPIMWPVEIIGIFSKPVALMIRLFANITAGHIIVLALISIIFVFKSVYVAPASVLFVVFMDVIELLVAFLQAYIFTLLSALFIGSAIEEHHH